MSPSRNSPVGFLTPSGNVSLRPLNPRSCPPASGLRLVVVTTSPEPEASRMSKILRSPVVVTASPAAAGSTPVSHTAITTPRPSQVGCSFKNASAPTSRFGISAERSETRSSSAGAVAADREPRPSTSRAKTRTEGNNMTKPLMKPKPPANAKRRSPKPTRARHQKVGQGLRPAPAPRPPAILFSIKS